MKYVDLKDYAYTVLKEVKYLKKNNNNREPAAFTVF